MTRGKILIVDDEQDLVDLISYNLKNAGFEAISAFRGPSALEKARREAPDLIILDLMLPDLDGIEICKILKREEATQQIPIIMLTARSEEVDRIVGLELGADDYVTKPFSPRELILRVRAILRRLQEAETPQEVISIGKLTLDIPRRRVLVNEQPATLTSTEFKLLVALIKKRGRVQDRENLLNDVWGYQADVYSRTVDTHVKRLRSKLGEAGDYIETIRGEGYRFREEVDDEN
ncbi:MAG: response regulator transcription factor [Candidatus Tectomicrobia bacterium]|nr:response regulator transcription factor [Candidatus Tectomicrobia bacterium]